MKSTRRIALLLAMVFLLPALFFSGYELSSLNKDEAMIQDVYNKQLEAILFSVNQYSDDILNRWISQIQNGHDEGIAAESNNPAIDDLLLLNPALTAIFVLDTIKGEPAPRVYSLDSDQANQIRGNLNGLLSQGLDKIVQLVSYKKSNFQKVEVLQNLDSATQERQWLIFILESRPGQLRLGGAIINPQIFLEAQLGPRLQSIARDQFVLSVIRKSTDASIYNTAPADTVSVVAEAITKEFWLLPDYALGIRTKGPSIQAVIQERTTTNIALLLSLDLALILAVILVFRNVKKEVQLAQNKSDFVSNVSHEIRTPLALISMFAETLEMGRVQSEEKKQEYYSIINKETHRLSGIVNKILSFSQAEANKKQLKLESVHPDTEIRTILKTYDFHLANKGFEYDYTDRPGLWIKADKEAFVEVVINLIDNAMKYSPGKKRIEISCREEKDFGLVVVKDYGTGISTQDQKHIFDKFYRVSSGNLARSQGTGLGLSLVKQLMDAQKGKITVSSNLDQGSTFTLYFPLSTPGLKHG